MTRRVVALGVACALLCAGSRAHADPIRFALMASPNGELGDAIARLAEGDLKKADLLFQHVLQNQPGQFYAVLGRAQVAINQQRLDDAEKAIDGVLTKSPAQPEAHNMKGVLLLLRKRPDEARREFSRALQIEPKYVTPRIYLAAMTRASGDYAGAVAAYRALVDAAPKLSVGYIGEAEAQVMAGDTAAALQTLEAWKRSDPTSILPSQVIASVQTALGNHPKAIQELNSALARHPAEPALKTSLGAAYAASGDLRSAAAQYEAVLTSAPASVAALLGLAEIDLHDNKVSSAIARYESALRIDPSNPIACNDVAWLLAIQGQELDRALRLAQTATSRSPEYVDAQDTLGWVHYQRSEYPAAIQAFERARGQAPDRMDVVAHLGLAYAKAGRKADAMKELSRALESGRPLDNRTELERVLAQLTGKGSPASS